MKLLQPRYTRSLGRDREKALNEVPVLSSGLLPPNFPAGPGLFIDSQLLRCFPDAPALFSTFGEETSRQARCGHQRVKAQEGYNTRYGLNRRLSVPLLPMEDALGSGT